MAISDSRKSTGTASNTSRSPLEFLNSLPEWLSIVGLFILFFWLVFPWIVWACADSWSTAGQFGDTFGGLSSGFSALAMLGALYTIYLQREASREAESQYQTQIAHNASQLEAARLGALLGALPSMIAALSERIDILRTKTSITLGFPVGSQSRYLKSLRYLKIRITVDYRAARSDFEKVKSQKVTIDAQGHQFPNKRQGAAARLAEARTNYWALQEIYRCYCELFRLRDLMKECESGLRSLKGEPKNSQKIN